MIAEESSVERSVNSGVICGAVFGIIGIVMTVGTVIGIIGAFQGMKAAEGTGIAAVAGGISEALIETAFGLLVAIPAVWAFNIFTNKVEAFTIEMDNSSSELIDYFIKRRELK